MYAQLLVDTSHIPVHSVLELGCGGGNNASYLKAIFSELVLTDISPDMVAVSSDLNPECEHHVGDMRNIRLNRLFDAVFVHDAICYMRTEDDLRQVFETAWLHCRPGGACLFAPDYVRENFKPSTDEGGHDEPGHPNGEVARGVRYLEWVWDPDPSDTLFTVEYVYLLRDRDGSVEAVHDRHIEGIFARQTWLSLLAEQGFQTRVVPLEHSEVEPGRHEMFVCQRPVRPHTS